MLKIEGPPCYQLFRPRFELLLAPFCERLLLVHSAGCLVSPLHPTQKCPESLLDRVLFGSVCRVSHLMWSNSELQVFRFGNAYSAVIRHSSESNSDSQKTSLLSFSSHSVSRKGLKQRYACVILDF